MSAWFWSAALAASFSVHAAQEVRVESSLDVAKVPSGFPVGFCLLTTNGHQYVAYYDTGHRMTVACRGIDSNAWQCQVLPSNVGWDSHNGITMTADEDGVLHLAGNMHASPLVYFRTTRPWDITAFERVPAMTGTNETRCTYPRFMRAPDGRLLFHYRSGHSGNGNEIYNVYDCATRRWKPFLSAPLTDGEGRMNAYMSGPAPGPDGRFHLCWVWRDTGDCQLNHDPSYARSADLVHWETVAGRPLRLPITPGTEGTLIDPVPVRGGIINGALHIGFDSAKQPIATYHKFDGNGNTQVYAARYEQGTWVPRKLTDWSYRWEFRGGGSIPFEIRLGALEPHGAGRLAMSYGHSKYGSGLLIVDEKTLALLGTEPQPSRHPAGLSRPESTWKGMRVNWAEDEGAVPEPGARYVLRWETLPVNRDLRREGPLPEPSMLRVYKLSPGATPSAPPG